MLPTSAPVLCLSDCHGCFYTVVRLLNAAPKGVQLVLLGDLIDRGPHSRQVVELAINHAIPTTSGNHEDLALAFYHRAYHCRGLYEDGIWLDNGGKETARNWPDVDDSQPGDTPARRRMLEYYRRVGGQVPDSVLDWMEGLPAYLCPSTQTDEGGLSLLASHSGYGLAADKGDWFQALWGRHVHGDGEFPDDQYWRTVGHTPMKAAQITERWGYLDTGAAYASRGGGVLSALLWPSKVILTQRYDETPVVPRFTILPGGLLT